MVSANDLKRDVERAGDDAGQGWGEGFTRGADGRIRNARGQFVKAGQDLGADMAKGMGEGLDRGLPAFESGMSRAVAATRGYKDEFKKLQDLMRDRAPWEVVSQQSQRVASAHNLARDAARGAGDAFKEFENAQKSLSSAANGATGALSGLGGAMGNVGAGGPATIAVVGALAVGVADLGGVAASAAQSLLLIPAAAGAAGAAIGTVALATYGFGDALKAVGDPKKFGEALKALSPNAQQAALSINALMPAFTQLRMATADAFFNNVGPQLNQLANQFLPTIRTLTTGIAGAMNQAFSGIAQQLMTPQTQQAIQTLTTNVVAAFQQLAPAVAPLTKALGDLMAAGSGFLPELAKAATDAAAAFSKFITEAKESGNLKKWMSEGLDTLKQLGEGAFVLGQMVMQLAPLGQQMLPDILTILKAIASEMPAIVFMLESMQAPLKMGAAAVDLFRTAFNDVKGVVETVVNASIPLINKLGDALNTALAPIRAAAKLIGMDIPTYTPIMNRGGGTVYKGAGVGGLGTAGLNTGGSDAGGFGLPTAGLSGVPNSGYAFPGTSWFPGQQMPGTWGGPPATKTGSSSALPAAPALPYDTSLPPGFAGVPQTTEVVSAENAWMDARHTLAEKQARVQQLEKTVGATADDITKAKNDVINAQQAQQQAEMRLYDTQNKQLKAQTAALSEFGVKLDQDLGISKGLAGIADNLVRFLGSLALAPWEAQMNAISNAPGQAQGGFGLIGELGAQGVFGPQYTAAGQAAAANGGGASALGPAALRPGGAYPGDAALLANVPRGIGQYDNVTKDLSRGLVDCASGVEDLVNIMDGKSTVGGSLWTGNASTVLPQMGFLPGMGGPGDFRIGYNSHHMQATLPGGSNVNFGSTPAIRAGGLDGGQGAYDPAFDQHYYRPAGATSGTAAAPTISVGAPGEAPAPSGFGGLPIPLPVTIVGGGGGFATPGGAPITPGGGPGVGGGAPDPYAPATSYPTSPSPGFSSGDITNPGLTNPPAPGASPGGWGMPGLPTGAGGAGQGPFLGAPGPGVGAAAGGPGGGPTRIGGGDGLSGSGKGGIGASDSTMALAGMAASALDVMAPGAGQAAQTAMKLANRAIQYGGQVAGIAVQGAMDTFLPFGGSKLASNSWATKLIGGIAGAAPALPNMAGKPAGPPPPGSPGSGNGSAAAPGTGGDTNITVNNQRATEDGTGRDVAHAMQNQYQPPAKP